MLDLGSASRPGAAQAGAGPPPDRPRGTGLVLWRGAQLRMRLTRLGLQYLAALALVAFAAVNTGNNQLYLVCSLMLGFFLVSGWASRDAIRGLHLLAIEEGNLFARVKGGIRVRISDARPRRTRGLELHLDLEAAQVEPGFHGGGFRKDGTIVLVLHTRPERRGWCRVRGLEVRTRYPFGFVEKTWRFQPEQDVLVLPHPRAAGQEEAPGRDAPREVPGPGLACPEGARPFRMGDPLGRVHWKRTAQRGEPWIRTYEGERPSGLHLHLDLRAWTPGPAFEKELERLSGAILQARLQKAEVALHLRSVEGYRECVSPTDCWRALATVQAQGGQGL